jgi:hypothetical protein
MPARKAKDDGGGPGNSRGLADLAAVKQAKQSGTELGYFYGLVERGTGQGSWDRIYMTPSLVEYVEIAPADIVDVTDRDPEDLVWVKVGAPMRHVVEGKVEVEP